PRAPTPRESSTDELACALPRYPAGYGVREVRTAFRCLKGVRAPIVGLGHKRSRIPALLAAGSTPAAQMSRVPEAAIEAASPSFRLAASARNPLANAVSEREPDGKSHGQVKYQGRHGHCFGNDHQIVSALASGKM